MSGGRRERITYLVACHDAERYVRDCILSLLAQTDPEWLAMIIDDASTDGSLAVIRSLPDNRIRWLANEQNIGYIATLEKLIALSDTDIIAILDADDALVPEATGTLLDAYESDPATAFVYSRFAICDLALARLETRGGPVPAGGTAIVDGPLGAIRSFRRTLYRQTDGLDADLSYAEDRDLVYKLEEVVPPVFVHAVLYLYRTVPDSQSHDPAMRETGIVNTRRARRRAISRRNVGGWRRLLWETWIATDAIASSARVSPPLRWLASGLSGICLRTIRASRSASWVRPAGARPPNRFDEATKR